MLAEPALMWLEDLGDQLLIRAIKVLRDHA